MKKGMNIVLMALLIAGLVTATACAVSKKNATGNENKVSDAVLEKVSPINGEYERDAGVRVKIDGGSFKLTCDGDYQIDTVIKDAYDDTNHEGRICLILENMTITDSNKSSAPIKECYYENKIIHLVVDYSFGERDLEYEWTDKAEFYYYDTVTDEYMPKIEGTWSSGDTSFTISNGKITFMYEGEITDGPCDICVVKENTSEYGRVFVANANLYLEGIGAYSWFQYSDGKLSARQMILDDDSPLITFSKTE